MLFQGPCVILGSSRSDAYQGCLDEGLKWETGENNTNLLLKFSLVLYLDNHLVGIKYNSVHHVQSNFQ